MKKRRMKTRTKVSEKTRRKRTRQRRRVVRCFCRRSRIKREENKRRRIGKKKKQRFIPAFFLMEKQKKILTLQVLKRAPVGLLHDDRLSFDSALFLSAFFCFCFFFRRSRRARAALVFSRTNAERKEVVFVREIDKREKNFYFHTLVREERESSFFWTFVGPYLLLCDTKREPLPSLSLREVSLRFRLLLNGSVY